jgi:excisionase family DNA binding protein
MAERLTYNLAEAAEALGIGRSHPSKLVCSGELPSLRWAAGG